MNVRVRPANDNRKVPTRDDAGDDSRGLRAKSGSRDLTSERVEIAKEVVGNAATVGERELVGGYIKASVELHFVGIDDLGREAGSDVNGEGGFTRAGGAKEEEKVIGRERGKHSRPLKAAGGREEKRERVVVVVVMERGVREGEGKCHRREKEVNDEVMFLL